MRNDGLSGDQPADTLIKQADCREIEESDDMLATDIYFSLMHYARGKEKITDTELMYFLQCLRGERSYSLEDKMRLFRQEIYTC